MTNPADLPLDAQDVAVLQQLAEIYAVLDPPPPDLSAKVSFAIALAGMDAEVARLTDRMAVGSGARGSERTRTITFDAESRAVMITVTDQADGLVRVDGWLAPGAALLVELRMPEPATPRVVTADDTGRFAFGDVPHGIAQLLVHPAADLAPRVVTPAFSL